MQIVKKIGQFIDILFDFIYPPTCLLCDEKLEKNEPLCARCMDRLMGSLRLTVHKDREDFNHLQGDIYFDEVMTCWNYGPDLEKLIHRLKYKRGFRVGQLLGDKAGEGLRRHYQDVGMTVMLPVPLHKVRQRERGYNQSEILCRELEHHMVIPFKRKVLVRYRKTESQTKLSAHERQYNVENAFRVERVDEVAGKSILLVDDVCTSGATLNSCASCLKKAGAGRVVGITLARPILK